MSLFITIISGISISMDAICVHLASTTPSTMGDIEYFMLGIQICVLLYNDFLILAIIFKNFTINFNLMCTDIILRIFSNIFYAVVAGKHLSDISNVFYILTYLNIAFSVVKVIHKSDDINERQRRIIPYQQQEKVTITIIGETIQTEENCSICLDPLNNTEVYKTKCSHIFHLECIKNYVNSNQFNEVKCPNCRELIISVKERLVNN
jgi:hypothetical protein